MPNNANINVRRLPANTSGRDFVIGDLHGELPKLERLLAHVRFDAARDRLFSVGDLVDRGADSLGSLRLLDNPWFFAVRGNHEEMLLTVLDEISTGVSRALRTLAWHAERGGGWIFGEHEWRAEHILDEVWARRASMRALPHLIAVGDGAWRFNVVHAELPDDATDGDIDVAFEGFTGETPRMSGVQEHLMWSRALADATWRSAKHRPTLRPDLSITFCGHSSRTIPTLRESHFRIDTGACYRGRYGEKLTMVEVGSGAIWQADDASVEPYAGGPER